MTRKRPRHQPDGDVAAEGARSPHTPDRQAGQEGADSRAATEPAAKSVSLPAFGFAKDLLEKKDAPLTAGDTPAEIAEHDPRRIFAFADSLEKRAGVTKPATIPVRLETWVAFSLAGEVFALPVRPIREVVRVASITRVPHAPKPIRGVTNMRGRVIPVIDLRLRIGLAPAQLDRASRVIVVASRGRLLGLLVDAVHQVIHIDPKQTQPPPDDVMTVQSDYISGVYHLDDQLILLLDIERALIIRDAVPAARNAPASESASSGTTAAGTTT